MVSNQKFSVTVLTVDLACEAFLQLSYSKGNYSHPSVSELERLSEDVSFKSNTRFDGQLKLETMLLQSSIFKTSNTKKELWKWSHVSICPFELGFPSDPFILSCVDHMS